jgi:N-glycosylase/DNA lyase
LDYFILLSPIIFKEETKHNIFEIHLSKNLVLGRYMAQKFTSEEIEALESIKIGKWDIISEYNRIDWLKKGSNEEEAKIHGIVIAIIGYKARTGKEKQPYTFETKGKEKGVSITHRNQEKFVTSAEFDKIIKKMGEKYYKTVFSPAIENLYNQGYSYEEVKKAVQIPSTIGAKISLDKFLPLLPE